MHRLYLFYIQVFLEWPLMISNPQNNHLLFFLHIDRIAVRLHGKPAKCTGMIAFVFFVIEFWICFSFLNENL